MIKLGDAKAGSDVAAEEFGSLFGYYGTLADTVALLEQCLPKESGGPFAGSIDEGGTKVAIDAGVANARNLWTVLERSRALQREIERDVNAASAVKELVALLRARLGG